MARWYIIHAYSGFENKVRNSILAEAERLGLSDGVEAVEVPTETVTEIKRGKKVQVERKFMPGYVLAKLQLTDDVYHLVKNTPKVTGFLGSASSRRRFPRRKPRAISAALRRRKLRPSAKSPSITRSATASRSTPARSPVSTAWSKNSISRRAGSRWRCRSSAAPLRWNWASMRLS